MNKQPVRSAGGWCWFILREKYCWLVGDGWFILREKYRWLVADKPNEQGENPEKWFDYRTSSKLSLSSPNGKCTSKRPAT
jgi:hypothetical protein